MSEFTDGLLVLKEYAPLAQAALADLSHPHIFKDLNEKWAAIFLDQPDDPAHSWILRHSADFPMLYFQDAEDHGWGYKLFYGGEERASLDVSYGISEGLAVDLAEQLYPGIDFYDFYGDLSFEKRDALYKQVTDSDGYIQQVAAQYINPRIEEFVLFDFSSEAIDQLREIVRTEWYEKEFNGLRQVEAFKRAIDINEMSWMSYHYLSREENEEDFDD